MENLSGSIERVTFYNPENGYSVLRIRPDEAQGVGENAEGLVTVTGNLPELAPGEYLKLHGEWVEHPKHGRQFQVDSMEQAYPATPATTSPFIRVVNANETKFRASATRIRFSLWPDGACAIRDKIN